MAGEATTNAMCKTSPDPPSRLGMRREIVSLWSIPDHQQNVRNASRAVRNPGPSGSAQERRLTARERYLREAYGAIRRKEERSKATQQMMP
jgi:hypothetical protein